MTPLLRMLEQHLPPRLALLALVLIYAGLLLVLVLVPASNFNTLYIDA